MQSPAGSSSRAAKDSALLSIEKCPFSRIYVIGSYAVMCIAGSFFCFRNRTVLVADGVDFINHLFLVVAFYEHSDIRGGGTLGEGFLSPSALRHTALPHPVPLFFIARDYYSVGNEKKPSVSRTFR